MTALPDDVVVRLVDAARAARDHAYVPYSGFDAGAAVLGGGGEVFGGALVENLVFGLAMCAERVAMFSALAQGERDLVALALAAPSTAGKRTMPCGPCLQVAIELGGPDLPVVSVGPEGDDLVVTSVGELAPGLPRRGRPAT